MSGSSLAAMAFLQCTGNKKSKGFQITLSVFRVVALKEDPYYWYLSITILLLGFEGVFTMAIKDSPEWKFFNPTIFLYLARFVPIHSDINHLHLPQRVPLHLADRAGQVGHQAGYQGGKRSFPQL